MEKKKRILKSAGAIGLATSLSRIFGYFRDASLAWILGAGFGMDAFTVAYRLANLFRRLVGENAMSAAFIPVFVQYQKEHSREELCDFARKFFYALALMAGVIVILEIVFAPFLVRIMAPGFDVAGGKFELAVLLTRLMAPYLVLIALAALLIGVLNSLGYFVLPALNPIFFNISVIAAAIFAAPFFQEPSVAIAFGVLIGGLLQVLTQIPMTLRQGMSYRFQISFRHPAIRKIGALILPSVFGIGVVQVNLLIGSLMASFLREGSVSQLYYADRVMELVLGIFTVSFATVILPDMARSAASNNMKELKETLMFSMRAIAFVAIPATVGLVLLSEPIVHVLFERGRFSPLDTEQTAAALVYYGLGLFFISAYRLIVSAFYSMQDTKTPARVAFVALGVNFVLSWILMQPLRQGGIALAMSLASALSVVQLVYFLEKRFGKLDWGKFRESTLKISVASAAMGVLCLLLLKGFGYDSARTLSWKIISLFGTIGLGAVAYLVLAIVLKADGGILLSKIRSVMKVKSFRQKT